MEPLSVSSAGVVSLPLGHLGSTGATAGQLVQTASGGQFIRAADLQVQLQQQQQQQQQLLLHQQQKGSHEKGKGKLKTQVDSWIRG
jgi:hypothetical protein